MDHDKPARQTPNKPAMQPTANACLTAIHLTVFQIFMIFFSDPKRQKME
jgi:hypothetical protein